MPSPVLVCFLKFIYFVSFVYRNKHLFMIQAEIIKRLKISREPNITLLDHLSPVQKYNMMNWYESMMNQTEDASSPDDVYARRYQYVKSSCEYI